MTDPFSRPPQARTWPMACGVALLWWAAAAAPVAAQPAAKPSRAAPDVVRLGVQAEAFPFAFNAGTSAAPVYRGYAVDLCLEVLKGWRKRQGRSFDSQKDVAWVEVNSRNRLLKLLAGEIDMECSSTSNTPGRRALGIAFSPTYFISGVGLLLRPELQAHAGSLMSLLAHVREADRVLTTTTGSTSQQHLQELAADTDAAGSKRLRLKMSADRKAAYALLMDDPPQAHAFMMDEVLLVAALGTDPRLHKAGLSLAAWSPVPSALECYGLMTRATNAPRLQAGGRDLTEVVRDVMLDLRLPRAKGAVSEMHALYQRWFQRPLAAADLPRGTAPGINLDVAPSPALSRVLVSRSGGHDCD